MPDLQQRFRSLDRIEVPDLREDVRTRTSGPRPPRPVIWGRILTAAVALALVAASVGLLTRTFLGGRQQGGDPAPAGTSVPMDRRSPSAAPEVDPVVVEALEVGWSNAVVHGFGSVWVTESANDGSNGGWLLRIDAATGDLVARIRVDTIPTWEWGGEGLAVGAGSVWVAGAVDTPGDSEAPGGGSDAALTRVDPSTNLAGETIRLGGLFTADVDVHATGVWVSIFAEGDSTELIRLDPLTHAVVARIPS